MKKPLLLLSLILCVAFNHLTAQMPAPFDKILGNINDTVTKKVLANPNEYRYQIVYTQINRDKNGRPSFTNYNLQVDPNKYFNPASMVKMPLAFLSLEKLNELNIPGVDKLLVCALIAAIKDRLRWQLIQVQKIRNLLLHILLNVPF